MPAKPSIWWRHGVRPRAHMRGSCAWSRLPSVPVHRCRAWRIDTPWCFWRRTVALAGAAWAWSGDPIRAVAVLVVATPCPLILAVPVALVSGLSRAAKQGILIKGGQALETLARVRSLVIDKTGTLTHGHARIVSIEVASGQSADELLRIAASLDQASQHIMAQTLVEAAQSKGLKLVVPGDVVETPGEGIEGLVQGHHVVVGGYRFVSERVLGIGLSLWRA